jgi:mediator of RNA polymerase II transcription subunit 13
MTASYCLGRRNTPLTTALTDVANEIWETTLEIISDCKVQWRIMIAKSGVMEPSEIEFWKGLVATERNKDQITLTLVTVDTSPSLTLIPPPVSIPPSILATHSSVYSTPVSTPQPFMVSPEQSGNASTPARDSGNINAPTPGESNAELRIDSDATLVDVTDQTWGVVLSHRLNNSNSLLEFMPTLASGYLIKRSGPGQTDIPVVIEVNIVLHEIQGKVIHHEVPVKTFEPLLREILGLYRGLATLARVRGVVDAAKDARPWHIAAAEKAVTALYMLM